MICLQGSANFAMLRWVRLQQLDCWCTAQGRFADPERLAFREAGPRQPLYRVRFSQVRPNPLQRLVPDMHCNLQGERIVRKGVPGQAAAVSEALRAEHRRRTCGRGMPATRATAWTWRSTRRGCSPPPRPTWRRRPRAAARCAALPQMGGAMPDMRTRMAPRMRMATRTATGQSTTATMSMRHAPFP